MDERSDTLFWPMILLSPAWFYYFITQVLPYLEEIERLRLLDSVAP